MQITFVTRNGFRTPATLAASFPIGPPNVEYAIVKFEEDLMARKAKDGTEYTNQMSVNKHNMRMESQESQSKPSATKDSAMSSSSDPTQQSDGSEQGDADSHIDAMLDMGMSPDEIHEHAKKRAGMEQSQEAEPATHSLSTIPGM